MPSISPEVSRDVSLKNCLLTERVERLKEAYFEAAPEICIERPRLVTQFSMEDGLFDKEKITILDKARMYRKVLENRKPVVRHAGGYKYTPFGLIPFDLVDTSPFAGSTTSRFKGLPRYPEFLALNLWPELWTISKRKSNPYNIHSHEVEALNFDVFPRWMENNILELTRKRASGNDREKIKLLERLVFFLTSKPQCISHTIPDFSRAIKEGLRTIIDEAEKKKVGASPSGVEFYNAIQEAMEGIIVYARNLAREAEKLASREKDGSLKEELLEIAKINRRVPEFSAQNFREGLSTVWICWTAIHLENPNIGLSLGRLDQVLYELYRQDMHNGEIDLQKAVELICYLWLKIGDHVPAMPDAGEQLFGGSGSNQAITIGGVDKDGKDAVNDLTYVILRATELMRLRDPNLNARYYQGVNTKEYLTRLCEANIVTGATPALHNDKAVIKALEAKGETPEQARDYGVIGCVEPGSNGRFYGHSASILLNLTSALELSMFNGKHRHTRETQIGPKTGDPATFNTFEEFWNAFEKQTRWLIEQSTALNNLFGETHQRFYTTPILSALFEGPMDKGEDLIKGGAVINSSGATIIGLADVADSLSAIQRVVFGECADDREKRVSFADLISALERNFEGGKDDEALQLRLSNKDKTPKYGNEDSMADKNVQQIVKLLDEAFGAIDNYRGGKYRVGYWTMTNHAGFGRLMGALPNGRKAHENFTSGITPVSGVTPDLVKALRSVASLPSECLSSGVALNLKFTPKDGDDKEMLKNFVAYVESYFGNDEEIGGMEIQFNVTSQDTFIDAVDHPEDYPELLVRVSGYTAYFKDLNPQMQKEIIDRTEYLLSTGKAVPYEPFKLR